ncbi:MAG: PorT family protein [Candidatus Latescibacteria bacterium]|nr:PorT family protein [Candidatus Latescibacterota bacterium]
MKTLTLCLSVLFALCLTMPANAQPRIGIIGGLNMANITMDLPSDEVQFNTRPVSGFGGVLDIGLNRYLSLSVEPMHLQKGAKVSILDENEEATLKLSYLEVPVLMKLALSARPTRPYLVVGPTFGFLRSAKVAYGRSETSTDEVRNRDRGLIFGAGLRIPAGKAAFFVEGRYTLGLLNINDEDSDGESDEPAVKNRGMQVMAGISLPLGR